MAYFTIIFVHEINLSRMSCIIISNLCHISYLVQPIVPTLLYLQSMGGNYNAFIWRIDMYMLILNYSTLKATNERWKQLCDAYINLSTGKVKCSELLFTPHLFTLGQFEFGDGIRVFIWKESTLNIHMEFVFIRALSFIVNEFTDTPKGGN